VRAPRAACVRQRVVLAGRRCGLHRAAICTSRTDPPTPVGGCTTAAGRVVVDRVVAGSSAASASADFAWSTHQRAAREAARVLAFRSVSRSIWSLSRPVSTLRATAINSAMSGDAIE
jgi:hypothetical protein